MSNCKDIYLFNPHYHHPCSTDWEHEVQSSFAELSKIIQQNEDLNREPALSYASLS